MANQEHVEILKQGVDVWNKWRKENTRFNPNLSSINLNGRYLSGANFTSTDFSHSIVSNANLSNCNFSHSFLFDTDFSNSNLSFSEFFGCYFLGSKLINSNLKNCQISYCSFLDVNIDNAINLGSIRVSIKSNIDLSTIRNNKNITNEFLLKIGLPQNYIDYLPSFYENPINMYSTFISHSWNDKEFARKLYEALIKKGVQVFFDEKNLKPGDDLYKGIDKGINVYDKMILVCSRASLNESWWVDKEINRILAKERKYHKEHGLDLLIPITVDDEIFKWDGAKTEDIRNRVIGDFTKWEDDAEFEKSLNLLVDALNVDRKPIDITSHLPKLKK